MPDFVEAGERIDAIEAEMKRLGLWRPDPLPPEMYDFKAAFATDTMPFVHWLQFIFIPRVREIIEARGTFSGVSQVGVQALREFDGYCEASDLVAQLNAVDDFIERG